MRIFLFIFSIFSANAFAGWSTAIMKDEMRGTETEITDTTAPSINGSGPKLYVSIIRSPNPDRKFNISFRLDDEYTKIDCKDSCEISMKFDNYKVSTGTFLSIDSGFITPSEPSTLIRAMSLADQLYIEIPATRGGSYQYKIDMNGLDKSIDAYPKIDIFGIQIGADKSTIPNYFEAYEESGCLSGKDVPLAEGLFKVPEVTLCVKKNKIMSAIFNITDKKQKKSLESYLTKIFESKDVVIPGTHTTWPERKFRIKYNTVGAGNIGKTYIISDDVSNYFMQ
ncbi:hypothetical protein [Pseudomonas helleri]|uniref:hypothetical protein n=1 Tax=Pseudomonas helleri TaxID=1608996 RepID=UPI0024321174|nr:hypothetical protein [Pseudomonas helleri]